MLIFAFSFMFLSLLAVLYFAGMQLKAQREATERETIRLQLLAESSFSYIRARSLSDLVTSKHLGKVQDLQLEEMKKEATPQKAPEPQWVTDAEGNELDLNEFDILS